MNSIDSLQQKDSAEQTTDTDPTPVCDGGRVDTDADDEGEEDDDSEPEEDDGEDDSSGSDDDDDEDNIRCANLSHTSDGQPIGAAIWLNVDELAAIGINPDRTDAVEVQVTDGNLELTPAHAGGSSQ